MDCQFRLPPNSPCIITSGGRADKYDTVLGLNAAYANLTAFKALKQHQSANYNLAC